MELRFQAGGPESWSADAVIVFLSEDEKLEKAYPELLDAAPWMSIAPGMRDFHGKKGEMGLLYGPPAHPLSRAVVVGLGKLDALTYAETLEEIRKGAGAAAVRCRELGVDTLALPVSGLARFNADVERTIEEIVCAAMLGLWRNKAFKSKEPEDADPRWLALLFCDANVPDFPRLAARRGETHAEAVILARNLANTPANSLTPEDMAEEARKLARRHDMNCEVLEREDIVSLGMGAFAAVAAGSANDPRLIILEHAPAGHADEAPLIVVGKGITFDSGGISIKPAAGMWEMKGDMGGAAAVMGLFEALGQLETPRRVIGLMACAENMPDARATRPGDVVKTLSGKTVEIVNTDAEGRLVLCDALTYAQRRWNPSMIVDVATLTGACVVAHTGEAGAVQTGDAADQGDTDGQDHAVHGQHIAQSLAQLKQEARGALAQDGGSGLGIAQEEEGGDGDHHGEDLDGEQETGADAASQLLQRALLVVDGAGQQQDDGSGAAQQGGGIAAEDGGHALGEGAG